MVRFLKASALCALLLAGCEDATKKSPDAIFKKTTQDIGEYDPNAKQVVSDSKVRANDPILSSLQAYGPMVEQISKTHIDSALQYFYVEHERYPNYQEFMEQVIKGQNIHLPVLPYKAKYQYDVANHKLVVIEGDPPVQGPKN